MTEYNKNNRLSIVTSMSKIKQLEIILSQIIYTNTDCWEWGGLYQNDLPIIGYKRLTGYSRKSVRGVICQLLKIHKIKHKLICRNSRCVNPNHYIMQKL